jgi:nitric oxide reductase large subunit
MKQWVLFLVALLALAFVLKVLPGMEKFYGGPPEGKMIDTSQQKRAMALEDSSYSQRTNHFVQNNDVGDAPGMATPWQVNRWSSKL